MLVTYAGILLLAALPTGPTPDPVAAPHFPDRVHAFVWRNWQLVPADDMARVLGTSKENVLKTGKAMGLADQPAITADQRQRSYITVIRRNWHLLPYDQMLDLLGWTEDELAYTLREDDFLYVKLGLLKPKCEPLKWAEPDDSVRAREEAIARTVREAFPDGAGKLEDPMFGFVADLSKPVQGAQTDYESSKIAPRFCYSYFALYGDAFMDGAPDPFPDGYLSRLSALGVNAVWLQGVLYKLAPFPWDPKLSENHEQRLKNLNALVARAKSHGMGVYLYLNEPRAMPLAFFEKNPDLKGAVENEHAALCTSAQSVQQYIASSVALICETVPDLAGFFTITASENFTNCWSHGNGAGCPRCSKRTPDAVIAEVNAMVNAGIRMASGAQRLVAWDWGWGDDWAEGAIKRLPPSASHMSVSEWSIPFTRGGIDNKVGEYSISVIGPGPRATKHWRAAERLPAPLRTFAKIQANTTWECGSVPYIPAVANVAKHIENLRDARVNGVMLGWTLGGYPAPNLEVAGKLIADPALSGEEAMKQVADRRFGIASSGEVVNAWKTCSTAFSEYPYDNSGLYSGPQHMGPANPLYEKATGYAASMVGFPYDALPAWRGAYPADVYVAQMQKAAKGFAEGSAKLKELLAYIDADHRDELQRELNVMEACGLHYASCANQARFIVLRDELLAQNAATDRAAACAEIESILKIEIDLARQLYAIQIRDSRLGFEATNHYFYVPIDLVEKVINCQDLLDRWLPTVRG
ncbi:MAG: hypothetical protein HUU46_01020 [Candidatus Hydrogenedentes bacterium]|nr:hypothetical protein [Candidatus Hydrogenedentota bacterium]